MKKNINIFLRSLACCSAALFCCVSCSGGGESATSEKNDSGFAPAKLDGDMVLVPTDPNVRGVITLTDTPAQVAYFNSTAGTSGAYTGNYSYTKVGPNIVRVEMDNVRYEPINTADDCYWTIMGYMTFVDEETVVFKGTETLVGSTGHVGGGNRTPGQEHDEDNWGESEHEYPAMDDTGTVGGNNHPIDFGGTDVNHFSEIIHAGGGTRNFQYNYKVQKNN